MKRLYVHSKLAFGFTLAELLISLAILGVIATFTIPKILNSGNDSKFNSIAKESMSTVVGAYQAYKIDNTPSASTSFPDIIPYINYVKIDSITDIDNAYTQGTRGCSETPENCLLLHNGALLFYHGTRTFSDTASTSALTFLLDPDGKVTGDGTGNTPGKSLRFYLYFNGRIADVANLSSGSYYSGTGPIGPDATYTPPWFSWSN